MSQIITTIGPASENEETILKLIKAGVDFFRLNFSHGSHQWHKNTIQKLRKISPNTPIILDTKGPEMRTGDMPKDFPTLNVQKGENLELVTEKSEANPAQKKIFVNHPHLPNDVEIGDIISIDSGLIESSVTSKENKNITVKILHGGIISSRRHINLVQKDVSLPTITSHDEEDIRFGIQNGIDIIALSFLRSPNGIETVQEIIIDEQKKMPEKALKNIIIWGKIESQKGIDNLSSIAQKADGLMVARGDLGVETPFEEIPYLQKKIINTMKKEKKFSIVATEMMESMTKNLRPTRAEVSDVALAVWEGADAVMLSGETANGKHPIETVQIMKKIILSAKKHITQSSPKLNFTEGLR